MLNLSDKELDRLSREAAQEHDPGDIVGPQSWEKLEVRLDRDLGRVNPNPFRGVRRFPFYYAPAILLILGVSYYFVRQNGKARKAEPPGSPPVSMVRPALPGETNNPTNDRSNDSLATKNPAYTENSTSTSNDSATAQYPASTGQPASSGQPLSSVQPGGTTPADRQSISAGIDHSAGENTYPASGSHYNSRNHTSGNRFAGSTRVPGSPSNGLHSTGRNGRHHPSPANGNGRQIDHTGNGSENDGVVSARNSVPTPVREAATPSSPRELPLSSVQKARSVKRSPIVDDAGLRNFTAKTAPTLPLKKKGVLRINRSLQIGLSLAPDFASVNSLAGDKPGSSFGLTLDYQFANRWYLGTGFLLSRKNYAARAEDYHAPYSFYQANNLHNIDFVKGTFNMLEIPLDLRYDFSVTGSTVFFASAGLSSYLLGSENCNYYYNYFGRENSKGFHYPNKENNLFSALNLSLGVEAGISNNLSLLVAPYMKIPTRNIGFGQIQMNSVGINFALKFAPVLSRKRR
jgi:hypothetical protein